MFRLILAIPLVCFGTVAEARTHRTKVTIVHKHIHHHVSAVAVPVQTYSVAPALAPDPAPVMTYYAAPVVVRSQTRKERKRAERAASVPSVSVTVQN